MKITHKMRCLYVLVGLGLYFTPSLSYSKDTRQTVFRNLISDFMESLQEGDLEGCYQARLSISKLVVAAEDEPASRKETRWVIRHMGKVFESASYSDGDNILHLIVRLEQSSALKTGRYQDLSKYMDFVFSGLDVEPFLQLLVKENDKGISPIQEAVNSNGLAYEALRTSFIRNQRYILNPNFLEKSRAWVGALSIILSLLGFAPDVAMAGVGVIIGSSLCYDAFMRKQNLQKTSGKLSLPHLLP